METFSDNTLEVASIHCLPEKPEKPLESDCCGNGCTPCVFDLYEQDVKLWEEECLQMKEGLPRITGNSQEHTKELELSTSEYKEFEIESVTKDTHDSYVFRFKLKPHCTLGLKVGQHIVLRWKNNTKTITRQYTPVSELSARGYFDVLIKIYADGVMSQYIKTWKVGDLIEWRGPYGRFTYTKGMTKRLVMLAAGTGLAPMAQVISHVLADEEDETRLQLLYACRTYDDLLLKSSLDNWADYWNFSVVYFLTEATPTGAGKIRYGDDVRHERFSEDFLKTGLVDDLQDTFVLICGTKSFDKDMVNYLKRLGLPESNFFKF